MLLQFKDQGETGVEELVKVVVVIHSVATVVECSSKLLQIKEQN
jgi:hypothetical protein